MQQPNRETEINLSAKAGSPLAEHLWSNSVSWFQPPPLTEAERRERILDDEYREVMGLPKYRPEDMPSVKEDLAALKPYLKQALAFLLGMNLLFWGVGFVVPVGYLPFTDNVLGAIIAVYLVVTVCRLI